MKSLFLDPEARPVEEWPNSLYMICDVPRNFLDMPVVDLMVEAVSIAQERNFQNSRNYTDDGSGKHSSNQYFTGKLAEVKHHIEVSLNRFDKIFNKDPSKKYVLLVFKVPNDIEIKTDKVYGQRIKSVNPEVIKPLYLKQVYFFEEK
jgi:hypothetical protein